MSFDSSPRMPRPSPLLLVFVAALGCSSRNVPTPFAESARPPPTAASAEAERASEPLAACARVSARGALADQALQISQSTDEAQWGPWLFDLASCNLHGVGELHLDATELYPHVGLLRERLREVLGHPLWNEKDHRGLSTAHVARTLLALWSHPDDDDEVERWLATSQHFASRPEVDHLGATPESAAGSWSKAHFVREMKGTGMKRPPPHSIRVIAAPEDERALVEHIVHYAHWGYAHQLVLVREDDGYHVRLVLETETWHMD